MGQNQISSLEAVDHALGAHLARMLAELDPASGPKELQRYLARPINQQILRTNKTDPLEFLKAVAAGQKQAGPDPLDTAQLVNQVELPLIAYTRATGFSTVEPVAEAYLHGVVFDQRPTPDSQQQGMQISKATIALDYTLNFLAWEKPTLDRMMLAWLFFVSNIKASGPRFLVNAQIHGHEIPLAAKFNDPKTLLFSDLSQTVQDRRLQVAQIAHAIQVEVLYGREVSYVTPIRHQFVIETIEA